MKKTLIIAATGVITVGGLTLAAINPWATSSTTENTSTATEQSAAQETEIQTENNTSPYGFSFFVNEVIYRVEVLENGFSQPTIVSNEGELEIIEMEKHFTTSVMPKDVFEVLPISENKIFYTGLQSNLDPNLWFYTERTDEGSDFNVRSFNVSTKEEKTLFNQSTSPNKEYAFKPFAVSNDNSVVYLEAFLFDSYLNNIEIWELDLNTLKVKELNVHSFYTNTPAMSPDGKFLLYPAASMPNDVHVTANQLFVYTIESGEETRIFADEKAFIGMKGWVKSK